MWAKKVQIGLIVKNSNGFVRIATVQSTWWWSTASIVFFYQFAHMFLSLFMVGIIIVSDKIYFPFHNTNFDVFLIASLSIVYSFNTSVGSRISQSGRQP